MSYLEYSCLAHNSNLINTHSITLFSCAPHNIGCYALRAPPLYQTKHSILDILWTGETDCQIFRRINNYLSLLETDNTNTGFQSLAQLKGRKSQNVGVCI